MDGLQAVEKVKTNGKKKRAAVQGGGKEPRKKLKVAVATAPEDTAGIGAAPVQELKAKKQKRGKEDGAKKGGQLHSKKALKGHQGASGKAENKPAKPVNLPEDVLAAFEKREGRPMSNEEMRREARKLAIARVKEEKKLAHLQTAQHPGRAKMTPKGIVSASLAEQVDFLWESFSACTGATFLEKEGLEENAMQRLSALGTLEDRLAEVNSAWRQQLADGSGELRGSPVVIFVSGSAVEANALIKQMPNFQRGCKVAKCFAKHIKVEEQRRMLDSLAVNIAVGTPHRMAALAELGSLKLGRLRLVVLDMKIDPKQRTLLDIPEVRSEWWRFFKRHIQPLMAAGTTRLALMDSDILKDPPL